MYLFIFISLFIILLFSGGLYDVVWVPTRKKDYDRIANLVDLNPKTIFYDLGSGTANILFYLSRKYNIKCVGIEISPLLYAYSKIKSLFFKNVKIFYGNLFKANIKPADIIYIFLHHDIYPKIIEKLDKDAKNDAKIIIACWPFDGLYSVKENKEKNNIDYYLYEKPFLRV